MDQLDSTVADALQQLQAELADEPIDWALTGSASFALQGVPVEPDDIDVQTTKEGAYAIAEQFSDHIAQPVRFSESASIRSHFGEVELNGVSVEIMGALQKRREDGTWESPVDIKPHREFVDFRGIRMPVLTLEYEAQAYERLGRLERAALLREYSDSPVDEW